MFEPGTTIGRYEIQSRLGRGGMGSVYVAHDPVLARMVAIKVFDGGLDLADARQRFAREARAAAALSHPNIVTVYDFGEYEAQSFIVMEYIAGETLAGFIRHKTPVTLADKVRWMEELCAGAGYAHQMQLVHRDIKPANVMIDSSGRLKILDFGIARMLALASNTAVIVGTPGYMAPEQITGSPVDHRADQFSIGVVSYELLAGTEAFPGNTLSMITHRILNEDPVPLGRLAPDAPPELVAIVQRTLRKQPADRFPDTDALRSAIARLRRETASQPWNLSTVVETRETPRQPSAAGMARLTPPPDPRRPALQAIARRRTMQLEAALQEAQRLLAQGQLESALDACQKALTLDENHVGALRLEDEIQSALHRPALAMPKEESAAGSQKEKRTLPLDEIQFTVYRPKTVRPGAWADLLVFAHLNDRRPDAPPGEPSPIERVRTLAGRKLGAEASTFRDTTEDARLGVPHEGSITLVPDISGIEFNPRWREFQWTEDVHEEDFRLKAASHLDGTVARGRLAAYLGVTLLAEVTLSIRVDSTPLSRDAERQSESTTAAAYRKIFACYSHKDVHIVRQHEAYVATLGDSYLKDVRVLRAGEQWGQALLRMIDQADVFQLFWSWNAMSSPHVRREWEYALSLNRPAFIRPTYWESPLPQSPDQDLPPDALRKLHFHQLTWSIVEDTTPTFAGPPRDSPQIDRVLPLSLGRDDPFSGRQRLPAAPSPPPLANYEPPTPGSLIAPPGKHHGRSPGREQPSIPPPPAAGSPQRAANTAHASGATLAAFLAGAGLEGIVPAPDLARDLGRMLRVIAAGILDTLRARQLLEDEFRMGMTIVQAAHNSPLMAARDVDEVIYSLLVGRTGGTPGPVEALEAVFDVLRAHEMASLIATQTAFVAMLTEFDPDRLEEAFDQRARGSLFRAPGRLRYWQQYCEKLQAITSDADAAFHALFGAAFAKAYNDHFHRLTTAR